jgi:adenylate kinase family enzyme
MKVRDRDMKVIYITGGSGSGKTTLAKYMARIMNYDYFVSGSGKDVLDGYDKEECIILDDLRADVFTKAELFKLTDNNTNSSVKSRFKNKDISYCKLMIITSIKKPQDLYDWKTNTFEDKDETFDQFTRRLGQVYVQIQDDGVVLNCKFNDITNKVDKELASINMSMVFDLLGIEKKIGSSNLDNIFAKIHDDYKAKKDLHEGSEDLPF